MVECVLVNVYAGMPVGTCINTHLHKHTQTHKFTHKLKSTVNNKAETKGNGEERIKEKKENDFHNSEYVPTSVDVR